MIKKAATFIVFTMVINVARSDEMEDRISVMLTEVTKGVDVVRIAETPISNIMKVELSNGNFVYVTRDAQFVFPGQLLQHRAGGLVNLTERDLAAKRKVELNSVDLTQTITFKARNEEKSEIYVFTDISCGYCKKFHRQIDEQADRRDGVLHHVGTVPHLDGKLEAAHADLVDRQFAGVARVLRVM